MTTTMDMTDMRSAARDLHKDQRGAIMLMGLCMSCFLIGGLWFLIGIGDTIVFRDNMQEATDHAAFTSAVLHAKGMNFISACNLILLAIIAIHILMGIIHDILLAICIVGALFSFGTSCIPWSDFRPLYTGYFSIMTPVAKGIHYLEEVAEIGYPFIALAKAYTLGSDYGAFGPKKRDVHILAVSTSLIPGNALSSVINKVFKQHAANAPAAGAAGPTQPASNGYSDGGQKGFLPVSPKHYDTVCKRIAAKGLDFLVGLAGVHLPGPAKDVFNSLVGTVLKARYCNDLGEGNIESAKELVGGKIDKGNDKIKEDNKAIADKNAGAKAGTTPQASVNPVKDSSSSGYVIDPGFSKFWGEDGPYVPWGGAGNGTAFQQIWAINIMPSFTDDSQKKVHIGTNNKAVTQDAKAYAYLAQSEFFYDCTNKWDSEECDHDDNAGYGIKWRARLRRLQLPQIGSLLSGFAGEFLKNLTAYKNFKESFGVGGKLGGLADKFGKTIGGAAGVSALSGVVDGLFEQIEQAVTGKILGPGGGEIDKLQNSLTGNFGVYH
jgi:hypothetical protein